MPWSIHKRGDKHCVVKDGESSPVPGGCHDSRADAVKHQRALYASEEVATVNEMSETKTPAGYWLVPMPETMTTASANVTVTVAVEDEEVEDEVVADLSEEAELVWEGVIGIEGLATTDRRYLIPGGISERDLPLTLMAQTQTADGHQGAEVAGKITEIWREPREDLGAGAIAIMGRGVFDAGEMGQETARMVEDEILRGVSLDLGVTEAEMLDPKTFEPVAEELDLMEMLTGDFITGIRGEILGATLCAFPAFRDATVAVVTASGHLSMESAFGISIAREVLTAAAAGMTPLHPPVDWFSNPHLNGPTALEISEDGRVFGHLALWGTCHTGIPGVCTTAPPSYTNYKMFHLGVVDTAESIPISCGQITLDTGHAPTSYAAEKTIAHYDDTGCAVADVVCGEDSFGIWVAGAVRPGIKAETVRKLRGSKLSGDWRSVGGHLELVGILAVNVPGFPVPRAQAAIAASAAGEGEVLALVAAGIVGDTTYRARRRKKSMLSARLREALGPKESTRARMRRAAMK